MQVQARHQLIVYGLTAALLGALVAAVIASLG
jgi:hypothetical protein